MNIGCIGIVHVGAKFQEVAELVASLFASFFLGLLLLTIWPSIALVIIIVVRVQVDLQILARGANVGHLTEMLDLRVEDMLEVVVSLLDYLGVC